jgi:hypothetical protein
MNNIHHTQTQNVYGLGFGIGFGLGHQVGFRA